MASGAAPLPAHIMDFLKVVFCCEVLQGYGMTENAAAASTTPLGYTRSGTIGEPVPCCEIRLEDAPELEYLHTGVFLMFGVSFFFFNDPCPCLFVLVY